MKTTGQCQKCQSFNIIKRKGKGSRQGDQILMNAWGTKKLVLDYCICSECGYTERYVQLNSKSEKIMKDLLDKQGGSYDEYV